MRSSMLGMVSWLLDCAFSWFNQLSLDARVGVPVTVNQKRLLVVRMLNQKRDLRGLIYLERDTINMPYN